MLTCDFNPAIGSRRAPYTASQVILTAHGRTILDAKARTGGATVVNNEPARDAQAVPRQGRPGSGATWRGGVVPARPPAPVAAGPGRPGPTGPSPARVRE